MRRRVFAPPPQRRAAVPARGSARCTVRGFARCPALCVVLCVTLCAALSSCGKVGGDAGVGTGSGAGGDVPESAVRQAVEGYNLSEKRSTGFTFSLANEGGDGNLVFMQGTINCKSGERAAFSGRVTSIEKGEGTTSAVYYKAGAYYRDTGKGAYYTATDSVGAFRSFFCASLPLPDGGDIGGVSKSEADGGTKYVFAAKCGGGALEMFGERVYGHCGMKKPRREKTECLGAEYTYIVGEGGVLKSVGIVLRLALYESAPYYPNHSVPDEDLRRVFRAELKLKVKELGEGVEIASPDTSKYTFLG